MEYILIFLEGIITFISPCMLPMLPLYVSYFTGQNVDKKKSKMLALINATSFVIGFTLVFTLLGTFSATLGMFLKENINIVNIFLGLVIIIFGINYMGVINIPVINSSKGIKMNVDRYNLVSSFVLGVIFSITWTPCVGAFLGAALSIIVINGNALKGISLIIVYSLGLGIPFILSALLIDKFKNTFEYIKKHYLVINRICGAFLCVIGILVMTGLVNQYFKLIS